MTIDRLIELFRTVSLAHFSVKTFSTGERHEFAVDGDEIYAAIHLNQPLLISSNAVNIGKINYQLSLLVLDKTDVAELGEGEMLEKTRKIALDIIQFINDRYQNEIGITEWNMTTVTEYSDNMDCGVLVELRCETFNPINLCEYESSFNI